VNCSSSSRRLQQSCKPKNREGALTSDCCASPHIAPVQKQQDCHSLKVCWNERKIACPTESCIQVTAGAQLAWSVQATCQPFEVPHSPMSLAAHHPKHCCSCLDTPTADHTLCLAGLGTTRWPELMSASENCHLWHDNRSQSFCVLFRLGALPECNALHQISL